MFNPDHSFLAVRDYSPDEIFADVSVTRIRKQITAAYSRYHGRAFLKGQRKTTENTSRDRRCRPPSFEPGTFKTQV